MENNIIIHVGLQKTGTKFLQYNLFPKIKDVNFIYPFHFSCKITPDKFNIISDETLSGSAHIDDKDLDNKYILAERLKRLFPNAKIILGIRNHLSMLDSLYRHYIKYGGHLTRGRWEKEILDITYINYDIYINYLSALFDDVFVYHQEELKDNATQVIKNLCNFITCPIPDYNFEIVNKGNSIIKTSLIRYKTYFAKRMSGLFRNYEKILC